jgi:hypothetical protein
MARSRHSAVRNRFAPGIIHPYAAVKSQSIKSFAFFSSSFGLNAVDTRARATANLVFPSAPIVASPGK